MSLINCEKCSRPVDTDIEEMRTLDKDVQVCDPCFEDNN